MTFTNYVALNMVWFLSNILAAARFSMLIVIHSGLTGMQGMMIIKDSYYTIRCEHD